MAALPFEMSSSLILASASPQRRAILERLGVAFVVRPSSVAELAEGDPEEVAVENALRKARAVHARAAGVGATGAGVGGSGATGEVATGSAVLGVDTVVALEGRIYGKPADERHARATVRALSGARHTVLSGIALLGDGEERTALAATEVVFRALDEGMIDWYLATGEWRGRAGGYAIQGAGAALVREVRGDYENVVGLPVATLLDLCPQLLGGGRAGPPPELPPVV
jgi:septum formation protein